MNNYYLFVVGAYSKNLFMSEYIYDNKFNINPPLFRVIYQFYFWLKSNSFIAFSLTFLITLTWAFFIFMMTTIFSVVSFVANKSSSFGLLFITATIKTYGKTHSFMLSIYVHNTEVLSFSPFGAHIGIWLANTASRTIKTTGLTNMLCYQHSFQKSIISIIVLTS